MRNRDSMPDRHDGKDGEMIEGGQVIPADLYEEMEALVLERFGEDWERDNKESRRCLTSVTSGLDTSDEMHLIGRPDATSERLDFDLWLDLPVAHVWDTDELAFSIFSQIAEDIF